MIAKTSGTHWLRWLTMLSVVFLVVCCRGASIESSTDGETHFLRVCTPESDTCGPGLSCTCGVCSSPCADAVDCAGLHRSAECVPTVERLSGSCGEMPTEAICDVPCAIDGDCGAINSGLVCTSGFCRASADLGPSDVSTAAVSSTGSSADPELCSEDQVLANELVVLGDVFVAQDSAIIAELETLARQAGALAPTENYRNYTSAMHNSLTVSGALLSDRYAAARSESAVKVVVMNGGGSDLLLRSCDTTPSVECPLMTEVVASANQLLSQMAADGVEDVVWFYYPDPMDAELLLELDVLRPLLEAACANAPLPCHWVDLRPTFDGHYGEYMQTDFVPTAEGAQAAAAVIWATMTAECIAQ